MRRNRAILFLVAIIGVKSVYSAVIFHDKTLYEGSTCQTGDKRSGTCSLECPTLTLEQLRDRKNICGFKKSVVIVCCPKVLFDESVKYPTIEQACIDSKHKKEQRNRTSDEVRRRKQSEEEEYAAFRKEYLKIVPDKNTKNILDCEEEAKKIGGQEEQSYRKWCKSLFIASNAISTTSLYVDYANKFPHMAAIGRYPLEDDAPVKWECTGTLIHRSFVVTSASCISGRDVPQIVRVGAINLLDTKRGAYDVDYAIEKVFVHDQHQPGKHHNDIALLKIRRIKKEEKRTFLPPLPACIWTQPEYQPEKVQMMGYGASGFGEEQASKLFKKKITSTGKCLQFYDPGRFYLSEIISKEICPVSSKEEASLCEVNPGAPLLLDTEDEQTTPYVVGISTKSPVCLKSEMVTKLHDHLEWIERVLSNNL